MTLEELTVQRGALLAAKFRGVRTVEMNGRHVTFGTDAETAAAISDVERRIAAAQDGGRRRRNTIRGSAVISGRSRPKAMLANSGSVSLGADDIIDAYGAPLNMREFLARLTGQQLPSR